MDPYDPDYLDDGIYTVPNPAKAPDPTVIDPVTGAPIPYPSSGQIPWTAPQSGAMPPGIPPMGSVGFMPYVPPGQTPKPAAAVPTYPKLSVEVIVHPGRPDRHYVTTLPDTITADANDVAKHGGLDAKGRFCAQFYNAKDVVYVRHGTAVNTWDRLYGVVEFTLRGDFDEGPEDIEKKWGASVPYDVKGPGYIHD